MQQGIKKVLVVGGAGYVGGAVVNELEKQGVPFAVYDNLTYENQYLKPNEFIYGDIRDRELLKKNLPNFSHLIWLAALVGDPACAIDPQLTKDVNQNAIEWVANNFAGRIIFPSTCSVYGANDEPADENSVINPLSVYAQSKYLAEGYLANKDALIFRLGTAFGIGPYSRIRMDLAVNFMTMKAMKHGYIEVFGGQQWRPFIHIDNIAKAMVNNLDSGKTGIYNLATENDNICEIAEKIKLLTNCEIRFSDKEFEDKRNYSADCSKAIREGILDLDKSKNIEFGIKQIIQIINEKRVNNLESEFYSNVKRLKSVLDDYVNLKINK